MTNVVPFRQPTPPAPHYLVAATLIDPHSPLDEGDLVAIQWVSKGEPGTVMFTRWWGQTGRDAGGRFVKKGSPDDHFQLDIMKYCARDLESPMPSGTTFNILGKVLGARSRVELFSPPLRAKRERAGFGPIRENESDMTLRTTPNAASYSCCKLSPAR